MYFYIYIARMPCFSKTFPPKNADMKKFMLQNLGKGVPESNWNKKKNFEHFYEKSTMEFSFSK